MLSMASEGTGSCCLAPTWFVKKKPIKKPPLGMPLRGCFSWVGKQCHLFPRLAPRHGDAASAPYAPPRPLVVCRCCAWECTSSRSGTSLRTR